LIAGLLLLSTGNAHAASCGPGAVTITSGSGGCDVDAAGTTTVNFEPGTSTDVLQLLGFSPSGAVTNTNANEGAVIVTSGSVTTQNTYGIGVGGQLYLVRSAVGTTFNIGHDISADEFSVNGLTIQTGGTITAGPSMLTGTYIQSGGDANFGPLVMNSGSIFI